jgi:hypothetical protein
VKDEMRASRSKGYDIEGKDELEAEAEAAKKIGNDNFRLGLFKVIAGILKIKDAIVKDPQAITFVGGSIFCIINKKNPGNSVARLIDPDHPILLSDLNPAGAPADVMSQQTHASALMTGAEKQESWKKYSDKWKESFKTGIENLIKYLTIHYAEIDFFEEKRRESWPRV